ncbi:MAG TPA: hypothetical protein VJB02_05880, partial [Coxiellaceae bacterium]|nr:hypothetical protein [Coxiellaceae bacterium]
DVTQADKEIQTLLHANPQVGLKEELHYFKKIHPDCIVHQVMDDTMKPFYEIGDYVAGVRVYEKGILGVLGKDCLVETADSRVIFRRLMRSTIEGCFNLMHLNPDTKVERPMMYDVDVVCAAPIIWIRKTG